MKKFFPLLSILTVSSFLVACSNESIQQPAQEEIVSESKSTENKPTNATDNKLCGSAPSKVNKEKIEQSLRKKGKITEDMTPEQVSEVVRNYINEKNKNFTRCIKGKK